MPDFLRGEASLQSPARVGLDRSLRDRAYGDAEFHQASLFLVQRPRLVHLLGQFVVKGVHLRVVVAELDVWSRQVRDASPPSGAPAGVYSQ